MNKNYISRRIYQFKQCALNVSKVATLFAVTCIIRHTHTNVLSELYPLCISFLYYFLVYFCELYLNYVINITILKHTHTHTHDDTHAFRVYVSNAYIYVDIPAYLGEFSICKEFKQRTFAHYTVADENQAKLIIEDWLNHVRVSLLLFLSPYLSLHNRKRHTHTHTHRVA